MKHNSRNRFVILAVPLAALIIAAGCGGTGTSTTGSTGSMQTSVSMTADHTTIAPGQTVNLSWVSQNASSVQTSNIGASTVNGTQAVSPTFSSDYAITVNGPQQKTATLHVTVTRSTPRFVIVGSSSHPDIPQIQSVLSKLGTVTVQSTMPTSPSSYDAVVIHASASISPADASTVTAALTAGKGVVLLGLAPSALATGLSAFTSTHATTDTKLDTTAVASWFGGVTELDRGITGYFHDFDSAVNLPFFALPATIDFTKGVYQSGGGDDGQLGYAPSGLVGVSCYGTIFSRFGTNQTIGFAFAEPTGGRLYWQWHFDGFDTTQQTTVAGIFSDGCLWAASP